MHRLHHRTRQETTPGTTPAPLRAGATASMTGSCLRAERRKQRWWSRDAGMQGAGGGRPDRTIATAWIAARQCGCHPRPAVPPALSARIRPRLRLSGSPTLCLCLMSLGGGGALRQHREGVQARAARRRLIGTGDGLRAGPARERGVARERPSWVRAREEGIGRTGVWEGWVDGHSMAMTVTMSSLWWACHASRSAVVGLGHLYAYPDSSPTHHRTFCAAIGTSVPSMGTSRGRSERGSSVCMTTIERMRRIGWGSSRGRRRGRGRKDFFVEGTKPRGGEGGGATGDRPHGAAGLARMQWQLAGGSQGAGWRRRARPAWVHQARLA